ncbi:hypothetical protein DFJ43DRAFT_1151771 [Lentinula guzmanii]|uniref:JmjC domain-containing protein n=1 Tax=Lentinula guzmanii TaxID=2804957 RepID=A0AA38N2J8_9AGAR|nr:hypothetical protein DFJ43DRAFT_1151771 [Lentinula guzmanii]
MTGRLLLILHQSVRMSLVLKFFEKLSTLSTSLQPVMGVLKGGLAPEEHAVEVVQYQDWISKEFPPARRQTIFHSRSILIRNAPHNIYNFNSLSDMEVLGEETLYNFALLKNRNSPSSHPNDSHFKATLEELIKSVELRQAIINCLNISIPSTKAPGCQGLATQAEAEGYIRERVDQEGMYWAIAGQKGAYSLLHMDANGLCTVVEPMTGQKYWVIVRPKDDVIMSSIDLMDILNVELEDISPFWNFYAVIIQPGDIFIMRPATPHYVMTVEDSLCFGSHCYSSQTLTQTALGIYHTLTTGGLI